jgi:hypothetical protein
MVHFEFPLAAPSAMDAGNGHRHPHLELEGNRTSVRLEEAVNVHEHFHFSVTIQSEEFFLISAMRGLARQCQREISRQIAADCDC